MSLEEITGDYFRPDWIDFPLAHYSEQSPNTSGLRYSDYAPWDGSFSQRVNISGGRNGDTIPLRSSTFQLHIAVWTRFLYN